LEPPAAGARSPLVARSRLALGPRRRPARDPRPLAPERLAALLALEVPASWTSGSPDRDPRSRPDDGEGKPDLGRRADRPRAAHQARASGLTADGPQVSSARRRWRRPRRP